MDPLTPNRLSPVVVTGTETTVIVPALPAADAPVPLRERVEDLRTKVEAFAAKDPIKAMAIALVAGWVVGKGIHALFGARGKKKEQVERVIIRSPRELEEWPA